jgi:hypothetical protein
MELLILKFSVGPCFSAATDTHTPSVCVQNVCRIKCVKMKTQKTVTSVEMGAVRVRCYIRQQLL